MIHQTHKNLSTLDKWTTITGTMQNSQTDNAREHNKDLANIQVTSDAQPTPTNLSAQADPYIPSKSNEITPDWTEISSQHHNRHIQYTDQPKETNSPTPKNTRAAIKQISM